jgi:hypothetical protein
VWRQPLCSDSLASDQLKFRSFSTRTACVERYYSKGLIVSPKWITPIMLVIMLMATGCATAGDRDRAGSSNRTQGRSSFELGPGVIVAGNEPMTYVMGRGGEIEAIDARTGDSVWRSSLAVKPLAVLGSSLIAQAVAKRPGVLPIEVFDLSNPETPPLSIEVPLPADVFAFIDQPLGSSFIAEARDEAGVVVISWSYLEQHVSSVAPAPGTSPILRRAEGGARLNIESGELQVLEDTSAPPLPVMPPSIRQMIEGGELQGAPSRAGHVLAAPTTRVIEGGDRQVLLRRWEADTGEELSDVVLFNGRPRAVVPSADNRHIVITSSSERAKAGEWERYQWSVFSMESGESVGNLRWHTSATPFCVLGGTLLTITQPFSRRVEGRIVEQPPALRAISLETGVQTWSHALRDTTYRGPFPAGPLGSLTD